MAGYWTERVRVEQLLDETAEEELSPLDRRLLAVRRREAARDARDRRRAEERARVAYWVDVVIGGA